MWLGKSSRVMRRRLNAFGISSTLVTISFLCMLLTISNISQNTRATAWNQEIELSTDAGTEIQFSPHVALDGNNIYAVWSDGEDGEPDVYFTYYDGMAWQPEQEISPDWPGVEFWVSCVAVGGGRIHVLFNSVHIMDWDVLYTYFDGVDWQPVQEVNVDLGTAYQEYPMMSVNGQNVHAVWMDDGDGDDDIYYRLFDGTSWGPIFEVSTDGGTERQSNPSIAVDGNEVHVVWMDTGGGDRDIYYRHFDGMSWQPEMELSTDSGAEWQGQPAVAAYGGKVHVVWVDEGGGDPDIYYRCFDGLSWQPEQEISTDVTLEMQETPDIVVEGDSVHVTWVDGGGGDRDIFHRFFNGTSWRSVEEVSTDAGTESQVAGRPAVLDGKLHVIWMDQEDGDWDIYYRNGTEVTGDITPPNSNVSPITPFWQPGPRIPVDWTAADDLELANITLYARDRPNNATPWTVWYEWVYNNTISGTSSSGTFLYGPPLLEGFYQFYSIAEDALGNLEDPPPTADAECGHDITPPSSSANPIVPYWTFWTPQLIEATAVDEVSQPAKVSLWFRYSADNATWIPWELFGDGLADPWSWDFDFPNGVGFYEFYSLAEDYAGNSESKPQTAEALVAFTDRVRPPSNTTVELTGPNLEDVTISWDLSPDDGGGNFMVIGYYVFKGPMFQPMGGWGYPTWDFVPPGVTSYMDIKAGEGDPNSYYYNICASDPHDFISCDYVQVSKQTRSLSQGINLISFPLIVPDESVRTVLQTVQFDKAWSYDSANREWKRYSSDKPYPGELVNINRTMAVWVDVTSECNLTVAGVVPMNTTIQLSVGWNLIGFPSFDPTYTVADLKTAVSSSRLEGYDTLAPYQLRVLADTEVPKAGYGYWVWVDAATSVVLYP